jgi:hypothetical protein
MTNAGANAMKKAFVMYLHANPVFEGFQISISPESGININNINDNTACFLIYRARHTTHYIGMKLVITKIARPPVEQTLYNLMTKNMAFNISRDELSRIPSDIYDYIIEINPLLLLRQLFA